MEYSERTSDQRLLDFSSRLLRVAVAFVPWMLTRPSRSPVIRQHRLEKLRDCTSIFGIVFATMRRKIDRMVASGASKN